MTLICRAAATATTRLATRTIHDSDCRIITSIYVANDVFYDSAPATVTITINSANDAPPNVTPTANNDAWVLSDLTLLPAATITPLVVP